jgi:hypothetical protein
MGEEHSSGKRPSTKAKHEKGQARQQKDAGGKKGDRRRKNQRRRPSS